MNCLLISYDNDSYIHHFPIGLASIASILEQSGYNVKIYNQDIHHYPEEHLTKYLDKSEFDIVAIGTVAGYYPYRKLLKISEAINKSHNRSHFKYIIGGHMVSANPIYFINKTEADSIIVGEGERSILDAIENNGIFKYPLIQDLDSLPIPAYHLFPIEYYRLRRIPHSENHDFTMSVITGRGCPFHCTFCYRLMEGVRLRSTAKIIDEIKYLQKNYGITYIDFEDDLTMTSKTRMTSICEAILRENLNIKWYCEGRLNFVDEDILTLMKRAGCVFINYGIEALDDEVLKNMKKALTVEQIIKGVEVTKKVGISQGLNIMWGNIGDTVETLNDAVLFLMNYDDGPQMRTIRFVTPYPGCELFDLALEKGLIKDVEDFYENKHINSDLLTVNFTGIPDGEMYNALHWANKRLLWHYYQKQEEKSNLLLDNLYYKKDTSFRGFRQT